MIKTTFKSAIRTDNTVSPVEIIVMKSDIAGIRCAALDDRKTELIREKLAEHAHIGKEAGFDVEVHPTPAAGADIRPVELAVAIAVMLTEQVRDDTGEFNTEVCVAAVGALDEGGNAVPVDMDLKDACRATQADLLYAAKGQKGLEGKDDEYDRIGEVTVPIFENMSTMRCIPDDVDEVVEQKLAV